MKLFTRHELVGTNKAKNAQLDALIEQVKGVHEGSFLIEDCFFTPDKLGYTMHIELGYLIQAMGESEDQFPIDLGNVQNLLFKKDYGLSSKKWLNDIEVSFRADYIPEDSEVEDDMTVFKNSARIRSGRHRLAALLSIIHLTMGDLTSEDVQGLMIRVRPSTYETDAQVADMQLMANTSRTMTNAEKSYGRVVRLDVDVTDPESLFEIAMNAKSASEITDVYRTAFSQVLGRQEAYEGITPNTMGDIGAAFYASMKKRSPTSKTLKFKGDTEIIVQYHLSLLNTASQELAGVIKEGGFTNLARSARSLGSLLALAVNKK